MPSSRGNDAEGGAAAGAVHRYEGHVFLPTGRYPVVAFVVGTDVKVEVGAFEARSGYEPLGHGGPGEPRRLGELGPSSQGPGAAEPPDRATVEKVKLLVRAACKRGPDAAADAPPPRRIVRWRGEK